MRILYVITQGERGGAQLYVKTLAQAGKAENQEVFAAIGEDSGSYLQRELEASGIKITNLKRLKRNISLLNDWLAVFELAGLYRQIKPDAIHLNSAKAGVIGSIAFWLMKLDRKTGVGNCRLIYTAHGWTFNEPLPWLKKCLYKILEKATAGQKNKIICVSEYDRWVALGEKIAPAEKLIAIHNGLDAAAMNFLSRDEARKKLLGRPAAEQEIIIGTIANFYPTKGLNYLIEALKILTQNALPFRAVIIGEGNLRFELEKQINGSGLQDRIILAGALPQAAQYLKAFDLAVLPSVKEGLPYFLLEAMAAGLPIVATKVGGIPEIIADSENGLLVEAKNPKALAEKIKLLAENESLRIKFAEKGLDRIKAEFSQSKMIKDTLALY